MLSQLALLLVVAASLAMLCDTAVPRGDSSPLQGGRGETSPSSEGCQEHGNACGRQEAEDMANLLQRRQPQQRPLAAVTFQGNGFRAFSSYLSVTAGLLRALRSADPFAWGVERLLHRFEVVSSTSGGSWYVTELAYSRRFLDLLLEMAVVPTHQVGRVAAQWLSLQSTFARLEELRPVGMDMHASRKGLSPLFTFLGNHNDKQEDSGAKKKDSGVATGQPENSSECLKVQLTWDIYVALMLHSTAGISPAARIGDEVHAWAKGKIWLNVVSLVASGGKNYENVLTTVIHNERNTLGYWVESDAGVQHPLYVPAKISIRWGENVAAKSPLPFCATPDCFHLRQHYVGIQHGRHTSQIFEAKSPQWGSFFDAAFAEVGHMSLVGAVSASSAWQGCSVLQDPSVCAPSRVTIGAATWMSQEPIHTQGWHFLNARRKLDTLYTSRVAEAAFVQDSSFADTNTQVIMDGAYSDPTGILHAVAAGASEVVAFLNEKDGFLNLFAGGNLTSTGAQPDIYAYEYQRIFAKNVHAVETEVNGFECFKVPPTEGKSMPDPNVVAPYLVSLCYGVVKTLTLKNMFAGTAAGRSITLKVIILNSSVKFGPVEGAGAHEAWQPYFSLTQEVTNAMFSWENLHHTRELLNTFLLGAE